MLKLDEKKIRKGKPIGLPYQGSKKKISKKIVEIIKQNFGTDKPIYDIFGGGGAITAECILNGLEVYYNDLDKDITNAFERIDEIKATNKSYQDFSKVSGAILYLDPPYEGTRQEGYKGVSSSFDSQEFYNWAFEMSKSNIVIISSYSISDERFEVVYSFDKARSTIQGGISSKDKNEKLFMVKNS